LYGAGGTAALPLLLEAGLALPAAATSSAGSYVALLLYPWMLLLLLMAAHVLRTY
jgi:hypothetical protein